MKENGSKQNDHLPVGVIVDRVMPFLDRTTWNSCTLACKDIHQSSQNGRPPPWPQKRLADSVHDLAFSPNGMYLALAVGSNQVLLYQVRRGLVHTLQTRIGMTRGMTGGMTDFFDIPYLLEWPTQDSLICCDFQRIQVWNMRDYSLGTSWYVGTYDETCTTKQTSECRSMAADGDKLAIGHRNGQITIWAIPEGDHLFSMNEGVHAMILTLKFVTNNRLVSVCRGNSVCVWNLNKKADDSLDEPVLSEFPTHFERYQWQKKCAKIRRERAGQPMPICTKLITDDPTGITITPRGTHVFIASGSSIRWWALNGQEEETPDNRQYASHFDGHDVNFTCIAFSDDGTKMASYSVDQSVRIWDVFTCKFQVVLEGHEHHVFGEKTQFSPDGKTLASRDGGVLRLWNVA